MHACICYKSINSNLCLCFNKELKPPGTHHSTKLFFTYNMIYICMQLHLHIQTPMHLDSNHFSHGRRHCMSSGCNLSLGSEHHNAQNHLDHCNTELCQHPHRSLALCILIKLGTLNLSIIGQSN